MGRPIWFLIATGVFAGFAFGEIEEDTIRAEIDSLKAVQMTLEQEVSMLQQRIDAIQQRVDSLHTVLVLATMRDAFQWGTMAQLAQTGKLLERPDIMSPSSMEIAKGTDVHVLGYSQGFFRVLHQGKEGYLSRFSFPQTAALDTIVIAGMTPGEREAYWRKAERKVAEERQMAKRRAELEQEMAEERAELEQEKAERRAILDGRYGRDTAARIMTGQIWLGMTREIARESKGKPHHVNRTVSASGTSEQWVYQLGSLSYLYLYFSNGVLTAWQD